MAPLLIPSGEGRSGLRVTERLQSIPSRGGSEARMEEGTPFWASP